LFSITYLLGIRYVEFEEFKSSKSTDDFRLSFELVSVVVDEFVPVDGTGVNVAVVAIC